MHQLGQPVAPSILFPVFNPPHPQGTHLDSRTERTDRDMWSESNLRHV